LRLARHNVRFHDFVGFEVIEGKVEDELPTRLEAEKNHYNVGMIDPPRAGLDKKALKFLSQTTKFNFLLYLSCNPEALTRDLAGFIECGWRIKQVMPVDFFPKTRHVETLVLLKGA